MYFSIHGEWNFFIWESSLFHSICEKCQKCVPCFLNVYNSRDKLQVMGSISCFVPSMQDTASFLRNQNQLLLMDSAWNRCPCSKPVLQCTWAISWNDWLWACCMPLLFSGECLRFAYRKFLNYLKDTVPEVHLVVNLRKYDGLDISTRWFV